MIPIDQKVIEYARSYLGVWYRYGGDSRHTGLDCSGFVCDVLRLPGIVPVKADYNAQSLFDFLVHNPASRSCKPPYPPASIMFYGIAPDKLSHVAIAIDAYFQIECAGGDHTTVTFDQAALRNAGVKESMISSRRGLQACVLPDYPRY